MVTITPKVESIVKVEEFAGRMVYKVTTSYGDDDRHVTHFNGPSKGLGSGPVWLNWSGGTHIRVESPARYGEDFGPAWIRAYYA